MLSAADHIASIESLIYARRYMNPASTIPGVIGEDGIDGSMPEGAVAFSGGGGSHAGSRCIFCKGTGFSGAFSCMHCGGTGHTQSSFG
ncbi:MAG: hypothetical protein WCT04_09655 [Planctomycetota bacterium]